MQGVILDSHRVLSVHQSTAHCGRIRQLVALHQRLYSSLVLQQRSPMIFDSLGPVWVPGMSEAHFVVRRGLKAKKSGSF